MEIQVYERPNLLWEAADLLCAYVNRVSPEKLTSNRPYCIPTPIVAELMEQVCSHVDRKDTWVRFFFEGFPMRVPSSDELQTASLGCILVRNALGGRDCDLMECRKVLHDRDLENHADKPVGINAVLAHGIDTLAAEDYQPISLLLRKVDMPEELRLSLTEALSNYHRYVDLLCDLLEPLAQRLEPLLTPWVENLRPRVEQWRSILETEEGLREFCFRMNLSVDGLERVQMSLHLFYPDVSVSWCAIQSKICRFSAGLQHLPLQDEQDELGEIEMTALRLLSGADRIKMLRAMSGRVMTQKEIALELGINSGTVFRDLNNLVLAHLVRIVHDGSYRGYTTNLDFLDRVTAHLNRYIRNAN